MLMKTQQIVFLIEIPHSRESYDGKTVKHSNWRGIFFSRASYSCSGMSSFLLGEAEPRWHFCFASQNTRTCSRAIFLER